jgi:hypothetical protein
MTTNVFEIVVGRGTLKWDAAWRAIEWFADSTEGHGLGDQFRNRFSKFCLGSEVSPIEVVVEYLLGRDTDGRTRHTDIAIGYPDLEHPESIALIDDLGANSPNSSRKINNLIAYADLCGSKFPNADLRIVVITDTTDIGKFTKLTEAFSRHRSATLLFLPLQVIGAWLEEIGRYDSPVVKDFAEWSMSL